MRRRVLALGFFIAALLAAAPSDAASITFTSDAVAPNADFTVSILLNDVSDLTAFTFDFGFDPLVVTPVAVEAGSIFGLGGFFSGYLPSDADFGRPGAITAMSDVLLGQGPTFSGSGTLALITFHALAAGGNAGLVALNVVLSDSLFREIDFDLQNGVVTVETPQPVPEPSTLALLGVGLAAMARKRLKKKPLEQ